MQSGFVPSMTALGVPQHKLRCTIAFGGSTRIDYQALAPEQKESFSLQQRELVETSVAVSTTCLSTSVPHSLGTCLETGIYTTGGGSWGGWEGEEPVLQKPVPKPVLEQVFVVHFVFGVGGWVGCSPCHRKICKGNLRISSTIGSLKFPPKTNSWGDFRRS